MRLDVGLQGEARLIVSEEQTAKAIGSGDVPVLATPILATLMERAAVHALSGALEETQTTVGGWIAIQHLAPTPIGVEVRAKAILIGIEGNRLAFHLVASDPFGKIAEGSHHRFIVERERFLAKADERLRRD